VLQNVVVDKTDVIRILHVDDDSSQGDFLNYFLPVSDGSFTIQPISDPGKVLDELRKNRYDCVVTDYQMPELNGIELAALIRKEFDIPIIIYTGQGSEEVAEAAFSVGIDDYLRKEMDPSHYQVLAKRIRSVVEKKRVDALYKTVIEQTRDALCIVVDKKIVFANKAMLELFGLNSVSEFGDNPFRFAVPEDQDKLIKRVDEVHSEKNWSPALNKYKIRHRDGRIIHVEVSTSPVTYYGKNGLISFLRNVTEREMLEAEKQESQNRLRSLVELAPDGILTFDLRGVITSCNTAFLNITGYSAEEIIGENFLALKTLRKSDLKNSFRVFSTLLKGKLPPPFEFKYVKKNGSINWGEAHIGVIEVSGKREFIAILRDISERKKNKPKDQVAELSSAPAEYLDNNLLRSIGQLAFLIGNELMEPLQDLKNQVECLKEEPQKLPELLPSMEDTLSLANLILDGFIRRTDDTILNPSEEDVTDIIMETIKKNKLPSSIQIQVKHVGDITANVDGEKLETVFDHLLSRLVSLVSERGNMKVVSESTSSCVKVVISFSSEEYSMKGEASSISKKIASDEDVVITKENIEVYGGVFNVEGNEEGVVVAFSLPTFVRGGHEKNVVDYTDILELAKRV